jgi:hypothetical protein
MFWSIVGLGFSGGFLGMFPSSGLRPPSPALRAGEGDLVISLLPFLPRGEGAREGG